MSALSTLPICLSLCSIFPPRISYALYIKFYSKSLHLSVAGGGGAFQGRCYGTEKQGEKRESPIGLNPYESGIDASHNYFLVFLLKRKIK